MSGYIDLLNERHPGIVPEHVQDPNTLIRPPLRQGLVGSPVATQQRQASAVAEAPTAVAAQAPLPTEGPDAHPQAPAPTQAPPVVAPKPAPPVPQKQPAAPAPVRQQPPPNIPSQAPTNPNPNQAPPIPNSQLQQEEAQQGGWRGLANKLGYGIGTVAGWLTKEQVENALESVQIEMASQDENILKLLPHSPMCNNNATDIALMASKIQRPPSDIITVINGRGDWREMSKSLDIPFDYIQLIKVSFNE